MVAIGNSLLKRLYRRFKKLRGSSRKDTVFKNGGFSLLSKLGEKFLKKPLGRWGPPIIWGEEDLGLNLERYSPRSHFLCLL